MIDPPVAAVRRRRTPDKQREEPKREAPPPAPPVAEAPPLPKSSDDESGGFGPPAALLRWQRPRAKSEHKVNTPYMSVFDRQVEDAKRLSSTLPWRSEDSDNKDTKEVSKDDSVLSRVSKDFESTVSVSKPPLTKSRTYHFDDVSKIQDWEQRQEEERQVEKYVLVSLGYSPCPKVIKLFSCSAQLRLKFILLINVKMPTIVGILTFMSRINYRLWSSKPSI